MFGEGIAEKKTTEDLQNILDKELHKVDGRIAEYFCVKIAELFHKNRQDREIDVTKKKPLLLHPATLYSFSLPPFTPYSFPLPPLPIREKSSLFFLGNKNF